MITYPAHIAQATFLLYLFLPGDNDERLSKLRALRWPL